MKSLQKLDSEAQFYYWGGDQMSAIGGTQLKNIADLAFMGFWEVLMNLSTILRNLRLCKAQIKEVQPDAIIFIDYPGFNMRIAEWAKNNGYRTYYFIAPQVWAWKEGRVKKLKAYIDRLYVILPFEKEFFAGHNMEVDYFGHPLLTQIQRYTSQHPQTSRDRCGLFPGSRKQEIKRLLPIMIQAAELTEESTFYISQAPHIPARFYEEIIPTTSTRTFHLVKGSSYALFNSCKAAMVTSGTASLECALFKVPEVVCYVGSSLSYQIARRLVKIRFIALANLIMDREIVTELIQDDCTPINLAHAFHQLLQHEKRTQIIQDYEALISELNTEGTLEVSDYIAQDILKRIKGTKIPSES